MAIPDPKATPGSPSWPDKMRARAREKHRDQSRAAERDGREAENERRGEGELERIEWRIREKQRVRKIFR